MPWPLRMTLLVAAITFFCMLYNTTRIYWYGRQTGVFRTYTVWGIIISAAVLIFAYPVSGWMIHQSSEGFSREWYPVWMIVIFWYGFIFNTVLLSWIIAIDILNAVVTWILKFRRPQIQTFFGLLVLTITGLVFIYTAGKTVYDTNRVKIDRMVVEDRSGKLSESNSFTIAHISEIHADRYTSPAKMDRYMRKVEKTRPDIILITGDLISSGVDYVEAAADAVSSVNPPLGVHFVMGDHDFWSGQEQIAEILEGRGVNVIRNANEWLEFGDQYVKITGVTEVYSTSIDRDQLHQLLNESRDEQLSILFSHQAPDDMIEIARESGTDILLAGHTHGGQIRIPVFFKKLTAASMETDYVIGHWWFDQMLLNINSGLGFTLAPVRYNAPAEVSVIELN